LYAIADRTTLDARGIAVAAFARNLRDAGVRLLQYRDKHGSPQQILAAAAQVSTAFAETDALLVMNDRADLAALAGWRAVHVGHLDMPPEPVRSVLGGTGLVGLSTHKEDQVFAADAGEADYIAFGPVFATSSKPDAEPVVGLEGLRRARALTRKPLVAIGGITRANARAVLEAGADSVAVIGGLFSETESVTEVARDFLRILG
jgi:thiamine-phosphate pyrophosphorylase